MIQAVVLYGHPTDPDAFEAYYANTHMPMATRALGPYVHHVDTAKFLPAPDGTKPEYYRIAALYFESLERMQQGFESPEGKAAVADLDNFATGGHKVLVGQVDDFGLATGQAGSVGAAATT